MELKENFKLKAIIYACFALAAAHEMIAIYSNFYDVDIETRLKMSLYYGLAWYTLCTIIASINIVKYLQKTKNPCPIQPLIKPNTLVKFDFSSMPKKHWQQYRNNFPNQETLVYLGEIEQLPGHCIICGYESGKIHCGFYTNNFIPLTENEI